MTLDCDPRLAGVRARARQSCIGRLFLGDSPQRTSACGSALVSAGARISATRARLSQRARRPAAEAADGEHEGDADGYEEGSSVVPRRASATPSHAWKPPKAGIPWSPKLSEVTYLPSVKFKGPIALGHGRSPFEISSVSEGASSRCASCLGCGLWTSPLPCMAGE